MCACVTVPVCHMSLMATCQFPAQGTLGVVGPSSALLSSPVVGSPPTFPCKLRAVIFSGGSGMSKFIDAANRVADSITFVVPVTDDGGSTGRIVSSLGGPGIGDIRMLFSRLPTAPGTEHMQSFLTYRLPADPALALKDWEHILDSTRMHPVWSNVPDHVHSVFVGFLRVFQQAAMSCSFSFDQGSLGNFLLTGASLYLGSVDAAVHVLSQLYGVPSSLRVLPVCHVPWGKRLCLAADLSDGSSIHGQNNISHPSVDGTVDKNDHSAMPARIERIRMVDEKGGDLFPSPHEEVVRALTAQGPATPNLIVYGRGSLYTSLIPNLLFSDVVNAIATVPARKVLITNGSHDRETTYTQETSEAKPMDCTEVVCDILSALGGYGATKHSHLAFITDVVVPKEGGIPLGDLEAAYPGIRVHRVGVDSYVNGKAIYDDVELIDLLVAIAAERPL